MPLLELQEQPEKEEDKDIGKVVETAKTMEGGLSHEQNAGGARDALVDENSPEQMNCWDAVIYLCAKSGELEKQVPPGSRASSPSFAPASPGPSWRASSVRASPTRRLVIAGTQGGCASARNFARPGCAPTSCAPTAAAPRARARATGHAADHERGDADGLAICSRPRTTQLGASTR